MAKKAVLMENVLHLILSRSKKTKKILDDECHVDDDVAFALPLHHISEVFKACLQSFWS